LLEERIRLREIDAYGNEDYKKWNDNPTLDEKAIDKNIFNGGRYDQLISDLGSKKKVPAVGAAINLK